MPSLYQDSEFTFHFAEDRLIPRFHLQGIELGRIVSVFRIEVASGRRTELLTKAIVGEEGWVDLTEPILMRTGEGFVVVAE